MLIDIRYQIFVRWGLCISQCQETDVHAEEIRTNQYMYTTLPYMNKVTMLNRVFRKVMVKFSERCRRSRVRSRGTRAFDTLVTTGKRH